MKKDSKGSPKWVSVLNNLIYCIIALCFVLMSCQKQPSDNNRPNPKPPDLSKCTRLEVIFSMPIEHFTPHLGDDYLGSDFLNDEQMEYLETTKKYIIDDKNDIRQIADAVNTGTFKAGGTEGVVHSLYLYGNKVIGFRNDKRIATINLYQSNFILDENNQRFNYDSSLPSLLLFVPEKNIKIYMRRQFCAGKLILIREIFIGIFRRPKTYPIPAQWCDIAIRNMIGNNEISEMQTSELFKCPCAGEGKCHYAMNPNCKMDSPPDMVLLFETMAGWNQHGGPELFTFDNHEPKGGCVLLNDGTVKFIRTEEELNALRWK